MNWRAQLPREWRGSRPIQFKLPGVEYSTILQVPSSVNSRLLRALSRIEPRLAKSTKYHVKLVEKSGKPLAKMFSTDFSDGKCGRVDCKVCSNPDTKGPSLCMVSNVVYEAVCALCNEKHKTDKQTPHQGKYVGETSRTLYERSCEHYALLENLDVTSFMYKHWAMAHDNLENPPEFRFKVVKKHSDPLSRLIHESVRISNSASLNSKSEWGGFRIARLTVDPPEWQRKKLLADQSKRDRVETEALLQFKDIKLGTTNNKKFDPCCRKRSQEMAEISEKLTGAVPKRAKNELLEKGPESSESAEVPQGMMRTKPMKLVSSKHGVWDPKKTKSTKSKKKAVLVIVLKLSN